MHKLEKFRVLLLYPNGALMNPPPIAVGIFTALLFKEDYEVQLFTVNNMIGFPGETRALVFDTIELNRKLVTDSINCSVFAPFHGTPLRKVCEEKGFVSEETIIGSVNKTFPLDMPEFTNDQIQGMHRTFVLYIRMPKSYWPKLAEAEVLNSKGDRILEEIKKEYAQMIGASQELETSGMTSS